MCVATFVFNETSRFLANSSVRQLRGEFIDAICFTLKEVELKQSNTRKAFSSLSCAS